VAADGAWKLAFPRLPAGTAELKPLHDLAKGLLDSSGAKPGSPFSRLPWPIARMHDAYRATRPTVGALIALARQTLEAYESHKRREGLLDFADLELHTRRLLLDPPPSLRGRFQLVLVDEFQDVNDLQAGIVDRLAPQRGRFLVGDVKQCIYQFRLANPEVFRGLVSREARWLTPESCPEDQPAPEGERLVVPLGVNFRSRRPVVDAVNAVFEELLTPEMIGCDYRSVALRYGYEAGLEPAPAAERGERGRSPTEIHILAREEGAKEEKPRSRVSAGEILAAEARLVARRLGELRDGGFEVFDRERKTWRRAGWADMVVLLRAPGSVGGRFAQALRAAGVPALFGIQPFFEREEIRDARNLLRILDNAHDDIGLAGLLRAPTVGFDDDDLLRLRLAWPESPTLIASLRAAAGEAGEPAGACAAAALFEEPAGRELAARCAAFLERLDRWRLQAQSGDLADAVTAACAEAGLLTAAASREGGIERAGNLQQLVALARRFAGERGHSLPGFVRYLDTIEASGGGPEAVASGDPAEPAARILSMHKAKGLEFPIVVLPLLGRSFNPTDAARSVLVGERWIGIDHFDPRTYVKEPTLARYLLAERRMMEIREEELRILYVAMTRAVEKLILTMAVASPWDEMLARLGPWRAPGAVRDAAARRIRSTGEALLGVLHRSDALAALTRPGMEAAWRESCTIHRHDLGSGAADGEGEPPPADGPLPETAPLSLEAALAALPALRRRVAAVYPHAAATRWRGKYWVTEVKRLIDRAREAEERAAGSELPRAPDPVPGAGMRGGRAAESGAARAAIDPAGAWPAADEGRWLHAILQELDLAAPDPFACARQLSARGEVPPAWISPENLDPIVRFLSSPLAAEMAAAPELQREASFSLRLPPGDLARIWPAAAELPPDEWILIQGQIDVLWPRPGGGYRLIDFKSDRPGVDRWLERAERYRPQMLLYREALRRIWGAGEVAGAIHFLRAGETVRVF